MEISIRAWSTEEKRALVEDGAVIYPSTETTIRTQRLGGQPFWYVVKAFQLKGKNRLLDYPSRLTEVAIYPYPDRFLVAKSIKEKVPAQREILFENLLEVQRRLGLENLAQTLPEAAEATEIIFRHFHATGERILGMNYKDRWMRTATPTEEVSDSYMGVHVAHVGEWAVPGLVVDQWRERNVEHTLGAACWLVPVHERFVTISEDMLRKAA